MATTIQTLSDIQQNLPADTPENQNLREVLLLEARKLMLSLERQDNAVERISFQLMETVACRIGVDLGIFELLEKATSPLSVNEIAAGTNGADPTLVGRLLRCLESFGAIDGSGESGYSVNTVSKALANKRHQACLLSCFDFLAPGWIVIPEYLREKKHQNPTSGTDTPFSKAYGFKDGATLWEILGTTSHIPVMGLWMESFNDGHKNFLDIYPVMERLAPGALTDPEAVMLVDIGGGQGHQAISMKQKFPELPGRYIVTDLAHGLPADKTANPGVEFLVHDFTKEMPIKGARIYYLRYISHDWPQKVLIQVLSHIREAMTPGYSKVIINDWVVPTQGASKFMTAQDLNMMAIGGGMERTKALHEEYLTGAGLKISGIWKADDDISESVIECELA
ncbi:O-methyltransferase family 2 protein [Rutstroemia sp. NJR-2017a BVV2]|nr:O-methyltransferase family 2 protein [Rutstroemia sp. NJR-2017a BVV2]